MNRFFQKNYIPGFDRFSVQQNIEMNIYPKDSVLKKGSVLDSRLNKLAKKLRDLKSNKLLQSKAKDKKQEKEEKKKDKKEK